MFEAALASALFLAASAPCATTVCSCTLLADVEQGVRRTLGWSAAVFVGRVVQRSDTSISRPAGPRGAEEQEQLTVVTFTVQQAWKGAEADTLRLYSRIDTCDYPFAAGGTYVVFAYSQPGAPPLADVSLSTSICSYTTEMCKAATVLAALGPPLRGRKS